VEADNGPAYLALYSLVAKKPETMRLPDHQASMSKPKLYLFLALLGAGLALLITLIRKDVFTDDRLLGTLTGIMTTLIIISATELIPELARWIGNFSRRGKFRALFGEYSFREDARLVFPYRFIDKNKVSEDPFSTFQKVPSENRPVPEGVVNWLAFQDIRAAVYVSNTLGEMTGRKAVALHDKDVVADPKNYCVISFGLGFTAFTHYVEGLFNPRLFKVEWENSPKQQNVFTDSFSIGNAIPSIPEIPKGDDIAMVARIIPPKQSQREAPRVWFICAGRTAPGTAAAGYFLAYRWDQIHKLYQKQGKDLASDSVVIVLSHRENQGDRSIDIAYEYDDSVKILEINGSPLVNWGKTHGD
jgi:hypothetical protein